MEPYQINIFFTKVIVKRLNAEKTSSKYMHCCACTIMHVIMTKKEPSGSQKETRMLCSYLQVCSVVWSENCHELVSSQGGPNNDIVVWKYPSMTRLAELKGHSDRVLALAMSPDGTNLVSGVHFLVVFKPVLCDPSTLCRLDSLWCHFHLRIDRIWKNCRGSPSLSPVS